MCELRARQLGQRRLQNVSRGKAEVHKVLGKDLWPQILPDGSAHEVPSRGPFA